MDSLIRTIILGVVQGLTEFLPVSSSGHLVIFQELLSFNTPGIIMEVILHAGTVFAIIYYYRKELSKISTQYLALIAIGTIPAALVGLFLNNLVGSLFDSLTIVGAALLLTAVFNFLADKQETDNKKITPMNALIIGVFQAIAIIPGISRSGATIFAALIIGTKRAEAARFSFLLSIPAVIGANLLEATSFNGQLMVSPANLLAGFIFAFLSGVVAIRLMVNFVKARSLKVFAVYTAVLGVIILLI